MSDFLLNIHHQNAGSQMLVSQMFNKLCIRKITPISQGLFFEICLKCALKDPAYFYTFLLAPSDLGAFKALFTRY